MKNFLNNLMAAVFAVMAAGTPFLLLADEPARLEKGEDYKATPTPQPEMSACEKQMLAILKELRKKPAEKPEKKIYEYVAVASSNERAMAEKVNVYLRDGRWELYGSPAGDGKGYWLQSLIRVKP